jgi:DNA-binding transcriptional ArsR family regulator
MLNPSFRSLMWYLLCGTRGGPNRVRLLERLHRSPANAHQLAASLGLDYRTVRHHLQLLERNGAVARPVGDAYAAPYELSPYLTEHFHDLKMELFEHGGPHSSMRKVARPRGSVEAIR